MNNDDQGWLTYWLSLGDCANTAIEIAEETVPPIDEQHDAAKARQQSTNVAPSGH